MAYPTNTVTMMDRLRRKPLMFLIAVTVLIFYVSPIYYTRSPYISLPVFCKNASCQLASSATAGVAETIWEDEYNSDYIVYTSGCKIMEMNPFDKSVRKFLKRGNAVKCSQRFSKLENQTLTIDETIIKGWKMKTLKCCYRAIHRVQQSPEKYNKDADWGVKYSGVCHHIPIGSKGVIVNDSFIKVECQGSGKFKGAVDFHGTALPPKDMSQATRKKTEYWDSRKKQDLPDPPSILVIGIDSISRMHMMRSLPRTKDFIHKNDFIELKGYNKVGENTFPNIMAGFGGMELNKYSSCWANKSVKLDVCPYIWKNFSDLNYITAFLEDSPGIAIFNFAKLGFVQPPADYYMRPLTVAMHKHAGWYRSSGRASCVAGQSPTDYQAKFIKDYIRNMGKQYPYFLFSWFTSIGHDDFNGLKTADDAFHNLFADALSNTSANPDNTIIIFMSDHGYRFGNFRETFLGFYEESLPFFFFRLPPSLKAKYPGWYSNLKRNSRQLTSPLDLHSTLKHILNEVKIQINSDNNDTLLHSYNPFAPSPPTEKSPSSQGLSFLEGIHRFLKLSREDQPGDAPEQLNFVNVSGNASFDSYYYYISGYDNLTSSEPLNPQYRPRYSFFEYIPNNRTCESATISQRYCMCGVTPQVSKTSALSSHLGDIVVSHVNYLLQSVIESGDCATLKFSKFLYGREVGHGEVWNNFHKLINYKDYLVALEVKPSHAHFESKIRILQNSTARILGDISRINSYKGQSDCVSDSRLKPYCFCKGMHSHHDKHYKNHHKPGRTLKKRQPFYSSSKNDLFSYTQRTDNHVGLTKPNKTSAATTLSSHSIKLISTSTTSTTQASTQVPTQGNKPTESTNRHIDKIPTGTKQN